LGNLTPPFVYGPAERLTCCKCALAVLLDAAAPASKEQRIVEARFSKDFRCVDVKPDDRIVRWCSWLRISRRSFLWRPNAHHLGFDDVFD
jgi:hypothetical protein